MKRVAARMALCLIALSSTARGEEMRRRNEGGIMKTSLLLATLGLLIATVACSADEQTISVAGSRPSAQGPAEYFTGNVRIDPLFAAKDAAPYSEAYVTFEPGARSNWHTHPAGQHLIVTSGVGWTQEWGGPIVEIRAGDVVWCPPGVKHWHGATPTTAMTHIAVTGTVGGNNVEWMEKVSDEQYRKR
jgi:quercetin dioxygenase-like cupin family protein